MQPPRDAVNVNPDTSIRLTLADRVTMEGGDGEHLLVVRGTMSLKILASGVEGAGTDTLTFHPKAKFHGGEIVTVKTAPDLRLVDSDCRVAPIEWRFRVRRPVGHA